MGSLEGSSPKNQSSVTFFKFQPSRVSSKKVSSKPTRKRKPSEGHFLIITSEAKLLVFSLTNTRAVILDIELILYDTSVVINLVSSLAVDWK